MVKDFSYSGSIMVNFKIPVGSYATILLRELMKPTSPTNSGF
jgi:tRNA(Glu) U13 pseudouridine synthase TruD